MRADRDYIFFVKVTDAEIRLYCRKIHYFVYQPVLVTDKEQTLLACRHLSALDSFLIVAPCRHPFRYMIAQEEYKRFAMSRLYRTTLWIPVARFCRVELAFV